MAKRKLEACQFAQSRKYLVRVLSILIIAASAAVAFANGANANFKGVASLYGSGTTGYWPAVHWAALATFAGCLVASSTSGVLLSVFTGKGLVSEGLIGQPRFLFAVAAGAGLANLLATWCGFPVSTTHLLLGGLLGAGLAASPSEVNGRQLWHGFVGPLLLAPVLAIIGGIVVYTALKALQLAPDHRTKVLDSLHFLSGGAVCFSRGLNDTAKMAALMAGSGLLSVKSAMVWVSVAMALGGWLGARHVAETLSRKVTDMNPGQGFAANLATSLLTTTASFHGLPVSTTHVSVGALLGIGTTTRQVKWKTAIPVLLAWLITLPSSAVISALLWWLTAGIS